MKKVKIEYLKDLPGIKSGQVLETTAIDAALRMVKAGTAKIVEEPKAEEPKAEEPKAEETKPKK